MVLAYSKNLPIESKSIIIKIIKNTLGDWRQVSKCDEFLELRVSQLCGHLKNDELNVPDEQAVYNAVLRWVEHKPEERREDMHNILKVNFTLLIYYYMQS